MAVEATKYCPRCGKVLKVSDFYHSKNLTKQPDSYLNLCKLCCTAHLDNWDSSTYVPLLEEMDLPYVPDEWNSLLEKWGNSPKLKPLTIIGKYVAKMRLNQQKDYNFADSEHLQQLKEKKMRDQIELDSRMRGEELTQSEIDQKIEEQKVKPPPKPVEAQTPVDPLEVEDVGFDLTDEDITYLKLKWGNTYRPFEWVYMERLYQDMMKSYDIQTAGHKDTLKMVCKCSLKANQLLDIGDIDGSLKMTKAYDSLMKSGRFTAAQNKAETGEYVDSVAEIAMMCEKHDFIPRYYVETPMDKVDWVLKDNQNYIKKLIADESNLEDMVERSLRLIEEDKNKEEDAEADDGTFEEELFADEDKVITDEDMIQFQEYEASLEKEDKQNILKDFNKIDQIRRVTRKKVDSDGAQ